MPGTMAGQGARDAPQTVANGALSAAPGRASSGAAPSLQIAGPTLATPVRRGTDLPAPSAGPRAALTLAGAPVAPPVRPAGDAEPAPGASELPPSVQPGPLSRSRLSAPTDPAGYETAALRPGYEVAALRADDDAVARLAPGPAPDPPVPGRAAAPASPIAPEAAAPVDPGMTGRLPATGLSAADMDGRPAAARYAAVAAPLRAAPPVLRQSDIGILGAGPASLSAPMPPAPLRPAPFAPPSVAAERSRVDRSEGDFADSLLAPGVSRGTGSPVPLAAPGPDIPFAAAASPDVAPPVAVAGVAPAQRWPAAWAGTAGLPPAPARPPIAPAATTATALAPAPAGDARPDGTGMAPPVRPVALGAAADVYLPAGVAIPDAALAALLRSGATLGRTVPLRLVPSQPTVRYYHEDDGAAARGIAAEFGALARDYSTFRPAPPPGTIDVLLP